MSYESTDRRTLVIDVPSTHYIHTIVAMINSIYDANVYNYPNGTEVVFIKGQK